MMRDSFLGRLLKKKEEIVYNISSAMREDLQKIEYYRQAAELAVAGTPEYYHLEFEMWDNRRR